MSSWNFYLLNLQVIKMNIIIVLTIVKYLAYEGCTIDKTVVKTGEAK